MNTTNFAGFVSAVQQRLRAVTGERDILKKALAYFADDQK
jgi:hypothetical protein